MAKILITCEWCGGKAQKYWRPSHKKPRFCNRSCSAKWRMSRPEFVATLDTDRRKEAGRRNLARARQDPKVQEKLRAHLHGPTNPFRNPENRRKAHETLRKQGWTQLNGGNGRGPTRPQLMLAEALGWPMEVAIPTGRGRPYPPVYKVDIANESLRLAIEVDGKGHRSRAGRARDAKKDGLLAELGWTVLRFWNEEVLNDLDSVLAVVRSTTSRLAQGTTLPGAS